MLRHRRERECRGRDAVSPQTLEGCDDQAPRSLRSRRPAHAKVLEVPGAARGQERTGKDGFRDAAAAGDERGASGEASASGTVRMNELRARAGRARCASVATTDATSSSSLPVPDVLGPVLLPPSTPALPGVVDQPAGASRRPIAAGPAPRCRGRTEAPSPQLQRQEKPSGASPHARLPRVTATRQTTAGDSAAHRLGRRTSDASIGQRPPRRRAGPIAAHGCRSAPRR